VVHDESRRAARTIEAGGVTARLVRKRVKNLTLRVYPPDGRVEVSAPLRMSERAVVAALHARREWIERHRRRFAAVARRDPLRCVDGETIAVLDERVTLRFAERGARPHGEPPAPTLLVTTAPGAGRAEKLAALQRRLRRVAAREFAAEVSLWAGRMGLPTPTVQVRRMTSRWGTCHVRAGKVVLNLALVTRPRACLEYVVVHELAHLLVPDHSPRFWSVVARHLPGWRDAKAALRAEPLWADAVWGPSADLGEAEEAR
jgi:predicted metal-dependent hydrolase